jgi:hypothetical protein
MTEIRIKLALLVGTFLVWGALLASACTPQQALVAHAATDVGEVACTAMVKGFAPGFEGLCALTDDALDKLIDSQVKPVALSEPRLSITTRAQVAPKTADASLLETARRVRAFRAAKPDGGT